ncbi:MAG: radical SAM protein [Candidatus Cloacimonetes bacterium]|nr:radical SAM protein [Candidatus Cloacimonadota bacterium]MDD4806621.1 radical SAM protein [Candidatus Cloacimonadota bacterium]
MNILLVSPKAQTGGLESLRKGNQILQGVLYVAAAAKAAGHSPMVVIADMDSIGAYIAKYRPQVLGVSCVTATYPIARDLLKYVKGHYPGLKTIIGGHHATFMYREVLAETGVDYVCRGEGEEVFPALLAALEAGVTYPEIEGIVFYKNEHYHNDSKIAIIDEIESLPKISRDLVDPGFSFSPKIVSSRGCPHRCSFCSISAFYNGKYRQRSVDSVISDIKDYIGWGYDTFWFHDDNLTVDTKWVYEFCDRLEQEQLKIKYNCMSRVDTIVKHPDLLRRMAETGCSLVCIGIESGIPEVLERMHKKLKISDVMKAIRIMNSLSLSHNWYMILGSGDEFDTPKHIEQNIRFFSSLPFGYVLISILTPFPGTELYQKLHSEGRIRHFNWEDYDVTHCVYQPLGMDHQALERYLPKAYLRVYLSKGWRLIPLFLQSFKRKAIRPGMIFAALRVMAANVFLGKDMHSALRKR